METIKQVVEDMLLTVARVRTGELLVSDTGDQGSTAEEVLVNIAERIVATTGIDERDVWTPDAIADLLDPWWGMRYESRDDPAGGEG